MILAGSFVIVFIIIDALTVIMLPVMYVYMILPGPRLIHNSTIG